MRLSEVQFSDVAIWPSWLKAAALVTTAGWLLGVGYWLVLGEQRRELASLVRAGSDLALAEAAKARAADAVPAMLQGRAQHRAALAAALRQLPSAIDLPALIEDLSRAALDSGLVIDSVHVSDEQVHGTYSAMPMALVVTGSYHQFGAFVAAAAGLSRPLTFHDFEVEVRGGRLTLTLAARAYRAADGAVGADVRADTTSAPSGHTGRTRVVYNGTGRSPFEVDRMPEQASPLVDARVKQALGDVALARLQMVGVLARRGTAYALVRDPSGDVHRVAAGDRLGLHGGRVTKIEFVRMDVVETVSDDAGGWLRRLRRLEPASIRDPQTEQQPAAPAPLAAWEEER